MILDFLSLIFSETCCSCNTHLYKNEKFICVKCRYNLPETKFHLEVSNILARRLWGRVPLSYAFAYLKFSKGNSVQKLLYHIKYKGRKDGAEILGKWYGRELKKLGLNNQFDVIIPVPLHYKRFAKRGYNQSEWFGKGLAEALNIKIEKEGLIRNVYSNSQTGKARYERWQNVKDVYLVNKKNEIESKHILLVDDVITTGSTVEICSKILFDAGAKKVSIAAIACAD